MSVLELFTYWVLDACRTEDTVMMEQVSGPLEYNYHHEAIFMIDQWRPIQAALYCVS